MKEYDPSLVDVIFALVPMSGFAADQMIEIEESEDAFTEVVGVDGDLTRVKNKGQVAIIRIHLMQSSQSNAVLSAAHQLDKKSDGGAGVSPILIRDRNGNSLFAADKAWITRNPNTGRGKQVGPNVWTLKATNYDMFEGGSAAI